MLGSLTRRLDSPFLCVLIVAVAYGMFITARLQRASWDASFFMTAGRIYTIPGKLPPKVRVYHEAGYDGQFYFRLAVNPFTRRQWAYGIALDRPAYRQQRIGYPFIVWLLSFLAPLEHLPKVMIVTNFLMLCAMGWIAGRYAQVMNLHAFSGIIVPFYPGFLLTQARDLTEITQATFLLGALLCIRRAKPGWAAALLSAAILTRETTAFVLVAAFLVWAYQQIQARRRAAAAPGGEVAAEAATDAKPTTPATEPAIPWYVFIVPGVVVALWQMVLVLRWGQMGIGNTHGMDFFTPFFGDFIAFISRMSIPRAPHEVLWFWECVFLIAFVVGVACYALWKGGGTLLEKTAWVFYLLLASSLSKLFWVEDWSYLRALTEVFVIGCVLLLGARRDVRLPLTVATVILWYFVRTYAIYAG
jgi:hypothetical protein